MIAKLNKHDPEAIWRPLRKAFACMLNVCDLFSAGTIRVDHIHRAITAAIASAFTIGNSCAIR